MLWGKVRQCGSNIELLPQDGAYTLIWLIISYIISEYIGEFPFLDPFVAYRREAYFIEHNETEWEQTSVKF